MANRWGNMETETLFSWAPKSPKTVIGAMKLKNAPWKKSYDQPRQLKAETLLCQKSPSSQGYGFSSSHVWM